MSTSNRILNYRRIQPWENYFLASGICSVAEAAGVKNGDYRDNFRYYAAFTGDMFSYLYNKDKPCDSGITNYFFDPQAVKRAFAAFGYDCTYVSNAEIKKDFNAAMNAIKASVDKGIPVLAWGIGNVTTKSGNHNDPLPEGCLIGGYDKDDLLYVNLYMGPDRAIVDDDGYTAITKGLDTTYGLFFVGDKIENTDLKTMYKNAIDFIPVFLNMVPADGYVFGKAAFNKWADILETDSYFENKTDKELEDICWNLHCSPYCCVCTGAAHEFISYAIEKYPELDTAVKLLPLYENMWTLKDEIWEMQGGFFPPMDKFRDHDFRAEIAGILRKMGDVCDEILAVFD